MACELAARMAATMDNVAKLVRKGDVENIEKFRKLCTKNIRVLNMAMKNGDNIGVKSTLQNAVAKMRGYQTKLKSLLIRGGGRRVNQWDRIRWHDLKSAFASRIRTGCIVNLKHTGPTSFLDDAKSMFTRRMKNELAKNPWLKVNVIFCGKFVKIDIEEFKYISTRNKPIGVDDDLGEWYNINIKGAILHDLGEFQEKDSGWALASVVDMIININTYSPQTASSYVELPPSIKRKKACVNVKNNDDACFAWAVVSALFPAKINSNRVSSYPHYSTVLNVHGITFPINRESISKFEQLNNISVNVYSLKNSECAPTRLTKNKKNKHVNLLLIEDPKDASKHHYVWIKNLSRLVSMQLNAYKGKKYICDRCLHYFHTEIKLQKHSEDCEQLNTCKITFPQDNIIKFKNFKNKMTVPFAVYADFECLLVPTEDAQKTHKHIPYSVGYYVKCSYDDSLSYYRSYKGLDCAKWFVSELEQLAEDIETVFWCPIPMSKLSRDEYRAFATAKECHICEKPLGAERFKDHCHLTGEFRGAAHPHCNLEYQDSKTVPVIFHNLSHYDGHLLVEELAKNKLKVIPDNTEQYIAMIMSLHDSDIKFKFIDSFRFMASSLEKLASYLESYPILESQFTQNVELLKRKGVFPYQYMDSWEKLYEKRLPHIDNFFNDLTNSPITKENYAHAQNVWETFECKDLGEYSDLYMKTDILLLADVFENFRSECSKNYGLDAAHYYTAPGLAWDAMLKCTGVELETLNDVDMLMFLERGIRGGLTQCSARYAKANNKFMPEYDPTQPSKYLMYYDINAMYSWAMCQYLPTGKLQWAENDINWNVADDSPVGYILEVDLEYPVDIHDRQSDLPMAPEKSLPPGSKETKMLATLYTKQKYVLHYRNLKQYVSEGLVLSKIHRVLQFNQADWVRPYIDLNTRLRQNSRNDFDKNLFKLMNNAVFGKMAENVRMRRDIKIVNKWEGRYGAEAYISKPNFKAATIFNENLVAIELFKNNMLFNKPIYAGMCILDISKTVLYDFHYKHMKSVYGDMCKLCYTDTDSLIYEITTDDVYEDMKKHLVRFDTSDYAADNRYGMPRVNKKIPGLMKDELCGNLLLEFVGLRAKMYSCRSENAGDIKKAKGVKQNVVRNEITFGDYIRCLTDNGEMVHHQKSIRSYHHGLHTTTQKKISLSPYDDKRFRVPAFTDTLPWGHYTVPV